MFRCENCGDVEWVEWSCLKSTACDIDLESDQCEFYSRVSQSERLFFFIECFALFSLTIGYQAAVPMIASRVYGFHFMEYVRI